MAQGWDRLWQKAEIRQQWQEASPWVVDGAERRRASGAKRAYDLGCGLGRHTIVLARLGFEVHGSDLSPTAVAYAKRRLEDEGLPAAVVQAEMTAAPYPDCCFDLVLSYNVIYHGPRAAVRRAIGEVWRVLRPGGHFLVTFASIGHYKYALSQRRVAEGRADQIEANTFVSRAGDVLEDADLPHHFSDESDVRDLLAQFTVRELSEFYTSETAAGGEVRLKAHWRAVAAKPLAR